MIRKKKAIYEAFASSARTATANSAAFDAEAWDSAMIYVDVTAYTSGNFTFTLQCSPDGGTTWHALSQGDGTSVTAMSVGSDAISAAGQTCWRVPGPIGSTVRVVATGASTPSATFSCDLELIKEGDGGL